jgi:hypothetical protein
MARRQRAGRWVSAGLLLAAVAAAQSGPDVVLFLEAQARLERRILADDVRRHAEARRREGEAQRAVNDLQTRLDRLIAADVPLVELDEAERALGAARAAAAAVAEEGRAVRQSLFQTRRRLQMIAEAARNATSARPEASPIDGTWDVRMFPVDEQGVFQLEAHGTLVGGSYALGGRRTGSFRGTWAGGLLRLERIDAAAGFDLTLEGRLDAGGERFHGTWQSTLLNNSGPTGGTWTATRRRPPPPPGG